MSSQFDVWQLLAGLGVFLYGMILLEESVRALSGKAFLSVWSATALARPTTF